MNTWEELPKHRTLIIHRLSYLEVKGHHCSIGETSIQNPPAAVEAEDSVWQRELLLKLLRLREGTSDSVNAELQPRHVYAEETLTPKIRLSM